MSVWFEQNWAIQMMVSAASLGGLVIWWSHQILTRKRQRVIEAEIAPMLDLAYRAWLGQDLQQAIQSFQQAAERLARLHAREQQALCYSKLGMLYLQQGDSWEEAACYGQKGIETLKKTLSWRLGRPRPKAQMMELLTAQAYALAQLGAPEQALANVRQALSYAHQVGATGWLPSGYVQMSHIATRPGKEALALSCLQQALVLAEERDTATQVAVLFELVQFAKDVQRDDRQAYRYARQILDLPLEAEQAAFMHLYMGQLCAESDELELAQTHYHQAAQSGGRQPSLSLWAHLGLAGIYAERSAPVQARQHWEAAEQLVPFVEPDERAEIWIQLATLSHRLGGTQRARRYLEQVLQLERDDETLWSSAQTAGVLLGHWQKEAGEYSDAYRTLNKVMERWLAYEREARSWVDSLTQDQAGEPAAPHFPGLTQTEQSVMRNLVRQQAHGELTWTTVSGQTRPRPVSHPEDERTIDVLVNDLLELLLAPPQEYESQPSDSALRALELTDALGAPGLTSLASLRATLLSLPPKTPTGHRLWDAYKQLTGRLYQLSLEQDGLSERPMTLAWLERRVQIKRQKCRLETQAIGIWQAIRQIEPDFGTTAPNHFCLSALQAGLAAGATPQEPAALLSYWETRERLYILALRSDVSTVVSAVVEINQTTLEARIQDLVRAIQREREWETSTVALSQYLLPDKIKESIRGCDRLFIIPRGSLRRLPFAVLMTEPGRYCIEEHALVYLLSASSVTRWVQDEPAPVRDALLLAVSQEHDPAESFIQAQVEAVTRWLPSTVYTGKAVSRQRVRQKAPQHSLLHITGHGDPGALEVAESSGDQLWPGILLSGNQFLSLQDLASTDLSTVALVNLGACSTNLGWPGRDDDWFTLGTSCLTSGAGAVLSTLWEAPAESTARLMDAFYRAYLGKRDDKANALRQAMLTVQRTRPHPRHWAAFTLMGDWR